MADEAMLKQKRPDIDLKKVYREFEVQNKSWQPMLKGFIKDTLASACERPYGEASAFFEAFGKAMVIKPDEFVKGSNYSLDRRGLGC